jgi:hypothetical protein
MDVPVTRLPSRDEWTAACRAAAADPGSWHHVGEVGPFRVGRPVRAPETVPLTVHGHAGDVTGSVDGVRLRVQAITAWHRLQQPTLRQADGVIATVGVPIEVVDRSGLHTRSPYGWLRAWAGTWDEPAIGADVLPDLRPHVLLDSWRATRWRGQLLLIAYAGEAAGLTAAPDGVMALDWKLVRPDLVTVQPTARWDRVTAALLEASASGDDLLVAAATAVDGPTTPEHADE